MVALIPGVLRRPYRKFPVFRLVWLWLLPGLLFSGATLAAAACPAGQARWCTGLCFCAPRDSAVLNQANRLLGKALQRWVEESRQRALANGVSPIPPGIREQLQAFFDPEILETVRYRVGDEIPTTLTHALLQNPDVSAVTLVDLIVFQHAEDAQSNVALWAHELTHVQQYRELGIDVFTTRYVRDYVSLESPAYQMQSRVRYALQHPAALAVFSGAVGD